MSKHIQLLRALASSTSLATALVGCERAPKSAVAGTAGGPATLQGQSTSTSAAVIPVATEAAPSTRPAINPVATEAAPTAIAPTGSVEGDVYLLVRSGDVKKGAGLQVRLLRHPDSVIAALAANCRGYDERLSVLKSKEETSKVVEDEIDEMDRTTNRADSIVAAYTAAEKGTGMNAHYSFKQVPTGRYLIHSMFAIGTSYYKWLVPVEIAAGSALVRDLNTEGANSEPSVYCHIK